MTAAPDAPRTRDVADARVVVLGMHRSGTSVVTRLVNLSGCPLAVDDDLLGFGADNPDGHWESATLLRLDDRLLEAFGGRWAWPPVLPAGWEATPRIEALASDATRAFHRVHPSRGWVCKDPRLCLTLPFWRACLDLSAVVLVIREPGAIARSIARRNHYRLGVGAALWEIYMRSALAACRGLPVVVVNYERLTDDPRRGVGLLREQFASLGLTCDGDEAAAVDAVGPPRERATTGVRLTAAQRRLQMALASLRGPYMTFPSVELGAPSPALRWRLRLPAMRVRR